MGRPSGPGAAWFQWGPPTACSGSHGSPCGPLTRQTIMRNTWPATTLPPIVTIPCAFQSTSTGTVSLNLHKYFQNCKWYLHTLQVSNLVSATKQTSKVSTDSELYISAFYKHAVVKFSFFSSLPASLSFLEGHSCSSACSSTLYLLQPFCCLRKDIRLPNPEDGRVEGAEVRPGLALAGAHRCEVQGISSLLYSTSFHPTPLFP